MSDFAAYNRQLANELGVCVLIPTYNNSQTLANVLSGVNEYCSSIIVVNDGSTDDTLNILKNFNQVIVIHHTENKGKGIAIKTGFNEALKLGYKYAITMDSDGQHYPDDLPYFLNAIRLKPDTILVGDRNMERAGIPGKSSFGNRFSNFWFRVDTGINLPDTQSGYRAYPLEFIKNIKLITWRFEFEVEILVKAAWKGIKISAIPVRVYYPPGHLRVSHFRPFRDFTRISLLNTVLFLQAFLFYIPLRNIKKWQKKGLRKTIFEAFHDPSDSYLIRSSSIGFGVFMGIFPVWGYQLIIGLAISYFLKLNKALFVVAAHISIPPMIPFILYLSYLTGSKLVQNPMHLHFNKKDFTIEAISQNLYQYVIGAVALATLAGLIAFLLSWLIYKGTGLFSSQNLSTEK